MLEHTLEQTNPQRRLRASRAAGSRCRQRRRRSGERANHPPRDRVAR